ncbi:MAG: hypothetical protein II153_02205 [Erysipelotrichaceae bacterium]|nr:hypothetical protein [Erysipelotrichaceae bacterium]
MSKKKNKEIPQAEKDYYKLKTDAVDRLAEANKGNARVVSDQELNQYKSSKLGMIPVWVKALFIKFWFAGAVCFFFYWGLSIYLPNWLDQMFVFAIGLGIVTDLLTSNVLKFISGDDKEYYPYIMFPSGKYWTFFANMLYAFILLMLTVGFYWLIHANVEPIFFGIIYTAFDMLFIKAKDLLMEKVFHKQEASAGKGK